jgi:midasin (ATPase involved in ribosome maturation)
MQNLNEQVRMRLNNVPKFEHTGTDNVKTIKITEPPKFIEFEEVQEDLKEINGENIKHAVESVKVKAKQPDAAELLKQLGQFIQAKPEAQEIDENKILQIVKAELSKQKPDKLEIVINNEVKATIEGQTHKQFKQVLKVASSRLHIWLTGSAGTGKTTTAEQVATALNLPFYCVSVCAQTTLSTLLGYNDAHGKFSETVFFKAYSEGGIFLLDEVDNGNANVLSVLNSALANGVCSFPCGMVKKHKDFICIAAANTIGTGGTLQYVGRNRIDAATLDRFVFINFELDAELETNLSNNKPFAATIQKLRAKAENKGLNVIISPRATINGSKLIAAGFTEAEALEMVIFNKLTAAEIAALKN